MEIEVVKLKRRANRCVNSPREVREYAKDIMDAAREVMVILLLDAKNGVLDYHVHSVGTVDSSAVYPREIVKRAILEDASSIILIHNHPSGNVEPSPCDKEITKDIVCGCQFLGLKVLDHLIIGGSAYYSFADEGLIQEYEFEALHNKS
jgi:DNA repair protein RadC